LQLFTALIALPPNCICNKYHDFERPMYSSQRFSFIKLNTISVMNNILSLLIQLHWVPSWSVAIQWWLLSSHY
jgi:hypothetical protein